MLLAAVPERVSFDMSDHPLVQRDALFCPKDLFYKVQALAENRCAIRLNDSALVRVRAKSIARVRARARHSEETTIEEIYVELTKILSLPGHITLTTNPHRARLQPSRAYGTAEREAAV